MNNFIGVRANKWECPENWAADDNSFIGNAPCGNDVPVFPSVRVLLINLLLNSILNRILLSHMLHQGWIQSLSSLF